MPGEMYVPAVEQEKDDVVFESHRKMEEIIAEIESKSSYKHGERRADGKEEIYSKEGKLFTVENVKNPEAKEVEEIMEFMEVFKPEEIDSIEVVKDAIESGEYGYVLIKDADGNVVSHTQTSYLELESNSEESIIFVGYTVTREDSRRIGLATESNRAAMQFALGRAKKEGTNLKAFVIEGAEGSEEFWNYMGHGRTFFEDNEGNFHEIPYFVPPMHLDEITGDPINPKTKEKTKNLKTYAVPEHLMIRMTEGRREINIQEVLSFVNEIYQDNYFKPEGFLGFTPEASEKSQEMVNVFKRELGDILEKAKDGKIYLLSGEKRKKKREELEAMGKEMHEIKIKETKSEIEKKEGLIKG
jgi:hypothetical protein